MQGAEHQMSGFRRGDGRLNGFQVAHFAHQNDVRVLTQGTAQGFRECRDVRPDLPLDHNALVVLVIKLDGVLDRDDVAGPFLIDDIDQTGQRGGLTGTRRAGHQDQSPGPIEQVLDGGRESDLFESEKLVRDLAEDRAQDSLLTEGADTETGLIFEGDTEVRSSVILDLLKLLRRSDRLDQPFRVFRGQIRKIQRRHLAVQTNDRRRAHLQVKVADALVHHELQEFIHFNHSESPFLYPVPDARPYVYFRTSSMVVSPFRIARIPSSRMVSMPS